MLNEFRIPFVGLKPGLHQYDFQLGETFFEQFETSEIEDADLQVTVELDKRENMLVLNFQLDGTVQSLCDRCQEALSLNINQDYELVVKFGEERGHTDEEFLILGPQDHEVDIAQYLYEYSHLSLPSRRVHTEPDSCDERILEILDQYSYGAEEEPDSDPRWEALKKLKGEEDEE